MALKLNQLFSLMSSPFVPSFVNVSCGFHALFFHLNFFGFPLLEYFSLISAIILLKLPSYLKTLLSLRSKFSWSIQHLHHPFEYFPCDFVHLMVKLPMDLIPHLFPSFAKSGCDFYLKILYVAFVCSMFVLDCFVLYFLVMFFYCKIHCNISIAWLSSLVLLKAHGRMTALLPSLYVSVFQIYISVNKAMPISYLSAVMVLETS